MSLPPSPSPQASPRTRSKRRQKIADGVSKIFGLHSRRSSSVLSDHSSPAENTQSPFGTTENPEAREASTGSSIPAHTSIEDPSVEPSIEPSVETPRRAEAMAAPVQPAANGHIEQPSSLQQVTAVRETLYRSQQKLQKELQAGEDAALAQGTSVEELLDFVAAERLKRMPHQGSRYDKVLRYAEHFANQVSAFDDGVSSFVINSHEASRLIWASCLVLLHMGHLQSHALERALGVFYNLGLVLAFFLRNHNAFGSSAEVRQELGNSFADLLALVTDVTSFYKRRHTDMKSTSVTIDFDNLFGKTIDSFYGRKDHVSSAVWAYQLQKNLDSRNITVDVHSIRRWLSPSDRTVRRLVTDPLGEKSYREEYTCEWFQKPLLDFLRSKHQSMLINGPPGSGKTVLSGWIIDRLQRPIGRKLYKTINYDIDADIASESSSLSMVKGLLVQLLEQSVGDVALYKSLANVYELNARSSNIEEVESALWRTLDTALSSSNNLLMTVDGLNGGNMSEADAARLVERLGALASKHAGVQSIILTRPFPKSPIPDAYQSSIEKSHAEADIRHVVRAVLGSRFGTQDKETQEKIVEATTQKSQGSFVVAILALQLLRQTSLAEHQKQIATVPQSIPEIIQNILTNLGSDRTKLILSWLLVAQRPLTIGEVQGLLETEPSKGKVGDSVPDIKAEIERFCGPLVSLNDGIVRFRHVSIRDSLAKIVAPKDAELDLTTRILLYVKLRMTRRIEPSFEALEPELAEELFRTNHLLEYTTRYWLLHFRQSPMYKLNNAPSVTTDFKKAFPDSTALAILEGTCWEVESGAKAALDMHILALQVRETVLGEKHESVLQSIINIATISEKLSLTEQSLTYYYRAVLLSQTVVGMYSSITYTCATLYLKIISHMKITSKTERTTEKERTLKYLVETHKHKGGATDEMAIKYNKMLAELYIAIGETALAASINRQIYVATVERYGQYSTEASKASQNLTTVLHKVSDKEDVVQYSKPVFENAERTMKVTDSRRVQATIHLADTYESQKEYAKAEEIYITLWRRMTELAAKEQSAVNHEKKIEITLLYVRFLRRHNRNDEAAGILRGLWSEYEHEEITNETTVKQLKVVGKELKAVGLATVALSVFSSLWVYFKKTNKHTTPEAADTAVLISETTSSSGAGAERHAPEGVLREVFESTAGQKVDVNTIKTCQTLSSYYISREKWSDALKVCQQLLKSIWPTLLSNQGHDLPKEYTDDLLEIATRLATCYYKERKDTDAEKTYLYIFHATKTNLRIQDKHVTDSAKHIIDFYVNANQPTKAVEIYEALLIDYRTTLGSTHTLTIRTLYTLGHLCQKYRIGNPDKYYLEIVQSLNKGRDVLDQDSMEAATILSGYYYDTRQWKSSQDIFSLLWKTFITRGKEYKITADFSETIYQRYTYVLEKELKVEYSVIYKITAEFKETCVKVYGATAEVTVKATLQLAEVCERSEKHQQEAINIYEEAFKTTGAATTGTTLAVVLASAKQRLARLYISNASASKENSAKAVTLYGEQFQNTREAHGSAHESTLSSLREMIVLWRKQNTAELTTAAERELKSTTIDVVTKESDPRKLFEAAISIATTYVSSGLVEQGWILLREMRRQVVYQDYSGADKAGFRIDAANYRRIYVFIVSFEETLKGNKRLNFSVVMASLLTEIFLYERYQVSLKERQSFEIVLLNGARLRTFLLEHDRQAEASQVEDEMFEMFVKGIASAVKTPRQTTRTFFIILLEELGREYHDSHLGNASCIAGNQRIYTLLEAGKFQEAFDLATCVFQFVHSHRGYHHSHNIGNGFKLSLYMAGRGIKKPTDSKLQSQMIDLSKSILRETLDACKHLQINFLQMQTPELNNLVALMGDQQNYDDLEWLLAELWAARHTTSWSSTTVVWIGRRLVEVRYSHGHGDAAIHLCEDICYNLRRVWGPLDATTVEFSNLLSALYATSGRHKEAMAVHEDLLRQEVSEDNEEPVTPAAAARAMSQLEFLKRCYARQGGFDKEAESYTDLVDQLKDVFGEEKGWKDVPGVDKWSKKGADNVGLFVKPTSWEFTSEKEKAKHQNVLKRRSGSGAWGILSGESKAGAVKA